MLHEPQKQYPSNSSTTEHTSPNCVPLRNKSQETETSTVHTSPYCNPRTYHIAVVEVVAVVGTILHEVSGHKRAACKPLRLIYTGAVPVHCPPTPALQLMECLKNAECALNATPSRPPFAMSTRRKRLRSTKSVHTLNAARSSSASCRRAATTREHHTHVHRSSLSQARCQRVRQRHGVL